jgi:hypothetical protein
MSIKGFAIVFGIVFLLAGIAGFIPGLSPAHKHPGLVVDGASRLALGLFPVNILHNLVHILFGIWGLAAARGTGAARLYATVVGISYAVLTVMGLIPVANIMFGLVPLYGNDVWLHALLAAVAAYFRWVHREAQVPAGRAESHSAAGSQRR